MEEYYDSSDKRTAQRCESDYSEGAGKQSLADGRTRQYIGKADLGLGAYIGKQFAALESYQQESDKKTENPTGLKADDGKSRIDLIDSEWLEGVGHVLRFGANKYAAHNWRGGIHVSRLIAGIYRHLGAINRGEDIDPESGMSHIYHLSCGAMFLSWMLKHRSDLDDRYKQ